MMFHGLLEYEIDLTQIMVDHVNDTTFRMRIKGPRSCMVTALGSHWKKLCPNEPWPMVATAFGFTTVLIGTVTFIAILTTKRVTPY